MPRQNKSCSDLRIGSHTISELKTMAANSAPDSPCRRRFNGRIREALLCGARATDTDATGALTDMYSRSEQATLCIDEIKHALLRSLSPAADAGSSELEEKRDHLREEAFTKNRQLKAVIDHLRCILNAIDGWNANAAAS